MELSLREAKARLSEAVSAATNGESVVITKHGQPVVEIVPVRKRGGMDFAEADRIQRELGLEGYTLDLPPDFDDHAFSRRVLGLED